jgi:uncharacterized protein with PIN domain
MESDVRGKDYLENCATECPFCQADIRTVQPEKMERTTSPESMPCVHVHMRCQNCRLKWVETHKMIEVGWVESRHVVVGAKVT